jgi:hypothetical protein
MLRSREGAVLDVRHDPECVQFMEGSLHIRSRRCSTRPRGASFAPRASLAPRELDLEPGTTTVSEAGMRAVVRERYGRDVRAAGVESSAHRREIGAEAAPYLAFSAPGGARLGLGAQAWPLAGAH